MSAAELESLAEQVKSLAGNSTADLIGIAPGSEFTTEELGDLGAAFGKVASIVVLAQRIVDPIQTVRFHSGPSYPESRISTSFGDAMLRDACWHVKGILQGAGWKAAIPRNLRYGTPDPRHRISYKKAAVLAGFGAFGRNQLLIHPEWGPWLWLRTVVTDAPLPPDDRLDFSPCDDCGRCLSVCPKGALTEDGIDRDACQRSVGEVPEGSTAIRLSPHGQENCEQCRRACPVGEAPPRLQLGGM
ncbi:MAG: 4Fe-4S binding protein [Armatimonadota bacterium]|nr:4Fe-4S binding protein [Armatimonadota bacterium]